MRKMLTLLLLGGCVLLGAARRPGVVFLMIWPGARSTAMGGAFSAIADDATANYYNQGGLAFIDRSMVTLQHANWLAALHEGMYYEYFGIAHPLKKGTLGIQAIYLTTGPTDVTDFQGNYIGTYTTFDIAVGPAYGLKLNEQIGMGIGWKVIYSYLVAPWVWGRLPELGIRTGGIGLAYAFDVGVLYRPFRFLTLAAAVQNVGPNISYTESGASDPLPYTLRLGLNATPISNRLVTLRVSADITKILVGMFAQTDSTFMQNLKYEIQEAWKGVGLEIAYFDFVFLRGGYFYDYEGRRIGFTFGGGIKAGGFSLDVGVDEAMYDFDTTNRKFSLTYRF